MSSRQQGIGKRWERKVAAWLRGIGYEGARRARQAHHRGNHPAGEAVPDIDGTPFWVECSATVKPESVQAFFSRAQVKFDQARRDRRETDSYRAVVVAIKSARFEGLFFGPSPPGVLPTTVWGFDEVAAMGLRDLRKRTPEKPLPLPKTLDA